MVCFDVPCKTTQFNCTNVFEIRTLFRLYYNYSCEWCQNASHNPWWWIEVRPVHGQAIMVNVKLLCCSAMNGLMRPARLNIIKKGKLFAAVSSIHTASPCAPRGTATDVDSVADSNVGLDWICSENVKSWYAPKIKAFSTGDSQWGSLSKVSDLLVNWVDQSAGSLPSPCCLPWYYWM